MYTDNSESFNKLLDDIELKVKQLKLMSDGLNSLDKHIIKKTIDRRIKDVRSNLSYSLRIINKDS